MIGIDTNVLVRFLTADDPVQSPIAQRLIESLSEAAPGLICREVMIETVWVLERAYGFDRAGITKALEGLLEARELVIEAADAIGLALHRYGKGGAGFADHLIGVITTQAGCETLYTFDRKAAQSVDATLLN